LQVAWKKADENHFLTVGDFTWTHHNKLIVDRHTEPDFVSHFNLLIKNVDKSDAGVYECQITAKHKLVRKVTLRVYGELSIKLSNNLSVRQNPLF
jgi:hypothetical protein